MHEIYSGFIKDFSSKIKKKLYEILNENKLFVVFIEIKGCNKISFGCEIFGMTFHDLFLILLILKGQF